MILILQNYTDNSSDLPVARKNPLPTGTPGQRKMTISCSDPADSYLVQLLAKIDLTGAETLFDMGCGPGTVSLALADKLHAVHGVDYSPKMLDVAARRASQMGITHAHWHCRAWESSWHDIPRCDIARRLPLNASWRYAGSDD